MTFALMLVCLVLTASHALYRVDLAFFDVAARWAHRSNVRPPAVIVVDARTIARLGRWPFGEEARLRMQDRLIESGVTAIGIDLASLRDAGSGRVPPAALSHSAGFDGADISCTDPSLPRCGVRVEAYSYVDVLDGTVSSDRLRNRPVVIRAYSGDGDAGARSERPFGSALSFATVIARGVAAGMFAVSAMPRPIGFTGELLFNELIVCLICACLYRSSPRAGLLASFGFAIALAAAAFAMFRFADRLVPPATGMLVCALAYLLLTWRRLEAVLRFVARLSDRMIAEPLLPAKPVPPRYFLDPVQHRIGRAATLDEQVRRHRELIDEWVDSLPEATLIASTTGTVLLANKRAAALCGEPDAQRASRSTPAGRSVSDVLFQITASHRASEFATQALAALNRWPDGDDLSAQTKSQLDQGIEIANARGGLSLLIKCAPIRASTCREGALVFHVADVSSMRMAERQRDMALRFLSHDMRSPQASILALVSQTRRDPSRYTLRRFAELVSHYATRALSLSDDFLFLAKAENLPPKLAPVDPALVLGDAVDDLLPQASAKSTVVNLVAEPGLSTLADVQLLRRAFVNLIGNAIKFGREASTVDVELSETDEHVKIAVTDYGIGISEQDHDKLFREFTQLDGNSSLSGHGLGLAFVKTVVDSLGGKLQVRSKLGEGTTFLMFLAKHDHDTALGH
ncbi:ATP-binding protein [Burkholderia territorii]|uniref:sensor histidine kinase n=1 Tax=Burkholderia territorii TaxID=1503055 RepID=UPI000757EDA9|nr:ATP-binding protein [Burkholderia territorii]KWE36539.1 histidine kinase [Burkholderia territorii]KWE39083.1 histidine kinase [Burkholderia territorii]KWE53881.1 histidine kinase [Burkholderia territorii]